MLFLSSGSDVQVSLVPVSVIANKAFLIYTIKHAEGGFPHGFGQRNARFISG